MLLLVVIFANSIAFVPCRRSYFENNALTELSFPLLFLAFFQKGNLEIFFLTFLAC